MAPKISISGELTAAAATERRFARNRRRAALRKRATSHDLHAEGLDDAVAGDGFVQDVLDLGELVLAAAAWCAHVPADFRWTETEMTGRNSSSTQASFPPSSTTTTAAVKIKVKNCCRNSASTLDMAYCTRSMSLMMVESSVPVVLSGKNAAERRRMALYRSSRRSVIMPKPA